MCNIYLKELHALTRGLISLNNMRPPTYRARHPHDPSASFPWVLTYEVEYLQSASRSLAFTITLVLIRTVVVVDVVNIKFLPVAERNKLFILLAAPAILADIYILKRTSCTEQGFDLSKQRVGTHLPRSSPTWSLCKFSLGTHLRC